MICDILWVSYQDDTHNISYHVMWYVIWCVISCDVSVVSDMTCALGAWNHWIWLFRVWDVIALCHIKSMSHDIHDQVHVTRYSWSSPCHMIFMISCECIMPGTYRVMLYVDWIWPVSCIPVVCTTSYRMMLHWYDISTMPPCCSRCWYVLIYHTVSYMTWYIKIHDIL